MAYTKHGPFVNGDPTHPINASFLNDLEAAALSIDPAVFNVKAYGAVGDGSTDDSAAVQAAVNACQTAGGGTVYFPPSGYWLVTTITSMPGVIFRGAGPDVTSISHPTESSWTFQVNTPADNYENHRSLIFKDFTIYGKYGIKVNNSDTIGSQPQEPIINGLFQNLRILYPTSVVTGYPNVNSATVLPTLSELTGQGVGMHLTNTINTLIAGCDFEGHGIGVLTWNADVSTIQSCRFAYNSRHIHFTHGGNGGGRMTIRGNEILTNYRLGGVFTDCVATKIDANYFESILGGAPDGVPMILRTEGNDQGLLFTNNDMDLDRIDSAIVSCSAMFPATFDNNHAQCATANVRNNHNFEMRFDYAWDTSNPNTVQWGNNPGINVPHKVRGKGYDEYLFAEGSIAPGNNSAGALGSYPFVLDTNTNRFVLRSDATPANVDLFLKSPAYRNFKIIFVGRKLTGGGYYNLIYSENGSNVTLTTGGTLGFTATSGVQAITITTSLPSGAQGRGYFEVQLANDQVAYERIELVPVS